MKMPLVTLFVAIAIAGLCTREELFITSKLWVQDMYVHDLT